MRLITAQPKGQTLVIILLGTSVALTVALAVSVRTISTLKQTTTSAQAQEALAAAEAGAEIALNNLKSGTCVNDGDPGCSSGDVTLTNGSIYSFVTTKAGGGNDAYLLDLAQDITQEVKLLGYTGGSVKVCWYDPNLDGTSEPSNALELMYVYDSGGTKGIAKYAYNGAATPANGFSSPSNGCTVSVGGKQVSFGHYVNVATNNTPQILRVKAMYGNVSAAVEPQSGVSLPAQGYVVASTGRSADGSVKKAIRVTKSLPALPAIFDYALYSGSTTQPLSK